MQSPNRETTMPTEMAYDPDLADIVDRLKRSRATETVVRKRLQPIVKATRDALQKAAKAVKGNSLIWAVSTQPVLNAGVGRESIERALQAMDALVINLKEAGFVVAGPTVSGYGMTFRLRLREKTSQVPHKPLPRASKLDLFLAPKVDYVPNGILGIEIGDDFNAWSTRRSSWETKTCPLEYLVGRVPFDLIMAVQWRRDRGKAKAEAERKQFDQEQERVAAARLLAERQQRRQRREAREDALLRTAERWRRCDLLRQFAEAVRQVAVEEIGSPDADPKIARWLAWAERVADRHDPLVRLRRSAPGRRRSR